MRVEIRKSGDPTCEHCGATELIMLPNGTPLERDIKKLLDEENAKLERDILAVFEAAAHDLRRKVDGEITAARAGLLATFMGRHAELADGINAFMETREVPRYRFAKRRWHRKLSAEIAVAVDDLRTQTRLA